MTRSRIAQESADQSPAGLPQESGNVPQASARQLVGSDQWCTPKWLADALDWFRLDPCSNRKSHIKADVTCRLDHTDQTDPSGTHRDGLAFDWECQRVFCNPPYSTPLPWAQKLRDHGGAWVALVKLDPTTKWWATLMEASPTVAPFRKRIKFEGEQSMTANFPSVLCFSRWTPPPALIPHLWLKRYA